MNGLLTMDAALEAVEEAFVKLAAGEATNSPRSRLRLSGGVFEMMAAAAPGLGVMGWNAHSVTQGSPARAYVQLSCTDTGEPLALIEASGLERIRTGAASGVATRYMARRDASTVGVIGTGQRARTQLGAVCRVREIRDARVFSRTPERGGRFAVEMSARTGIPVTAVNSVEACVKEAEIVVTTASASRPVLSGEWLAPGAHVNAAGVSHWMRRELDDEVVRRSGVVVTDDVEQAKLECDDLIQPVEQGIIVWEQVHSLAEVVAGRARGRTADDDITLFESLGIALEDIAAAAKVYELALERGIGHRLPF